MKNKLLITLLALAISPIMGFSQVDIMPWAGYNFGARAGIYGGELKVKGAGTYGINLDYNLDRDNAIQFSYSYTSSTIRINDYYYPGPGGGTEQNFSNVSENYFLLGGVRYFMDEKIKPYGSLSMGMAYYNITNVDSYYQQYSQNDMVRFAVGFGLGMKVMITDMIGIDMHIRALAPIQWGGVGIGVGTGGASAGVYAGSSFLSGDIGGGLIFRLGDK
jgi:hypothetical protein